MPGITNPTEEYFKNGQWGWDGSRWRKQPLGWGYTDTYAEFVTVNNVPAGTNLVTFSTVPGGEIWVVTYWAAYAVQANPTYVQFTPRIDGGTRLLKTVAYPTGFITVDGPFPLILISGDHLEAQFTGCALNDDLRSGAAGYKMEVS